MIGSRRMHPDAVRKFSIDWNKWPFPPGARIASITWRVPPALTIVNQSLFGTKATIKLKWSSAAQPLQDYVVECLMVTTEQGIEPSRDVRSIGITMKGRFS